MQILTSAKNPHVLAWRSLRDKKGRDAQDAFLVEGTRMVREALSSGFRVHAAFWAKDTCGVVYCGAPYPFCPAPYPCIPWG